MCVYFDPDNHNLFLAGEGRHMELSTGFLGAEWILSFDNEEKGIGPGLIRFLRLQALHSNPEVVSC